MVENEREEGLGSFIGTVVSTGQQSFSCMCAYMGNTGNFSKIPIPGGKHQYRSIVFCSKKSIYDHCILVMIG